VQHRETSLRDTSHIPQALTTTLIPKGGNNAMGKDKITSETEEKQEGTVELMPCLSEIFDIEILLKDVWNEEIMPIDRTSENLRKILLLLTRGLIEKIIYYQHKYDFRVEEEEEYYTEDLVKFIEMANTKVA
jgi:IS4 transposase